jgi:hypothetical protein
MPIPELEELKSRVQAMRDELDTVTDQEWQAYVKVRDILAFDLGMGPDGSLGSLRVVRCAMMGIFETPDGSRRHGEYDAGAVQRFADLGG